MRRAAKAWGQARREFEHGKAQNIDHQHRPAAEAVGGKAKDKSAERPCRERKKDRESDIRHIRAEFLRDVVHDEDENEEIESIERPAEIARQNRAALFGREVLHHMKHVRSSRTGGRRVQRQGQACHNFGKGVSLNFGEFRC